MSLETVLAALHQNPGDHLGWLAIADCLEEQGETERAELARLSALVRITDSETESGRMMARLRELLAQGVKPCVPTITNSIGMEFALIPPGRCLMGSPGSEPDREDDEYQHEVNLTRGFYLGFHPVTQEQYQNVMGHNPAYFNEQQTSLDTRRFPVDQVSWFDALNFVARMNEREKRTQPERLYRLPTEAEWEYSCRGPASFKISSAFHVGDTLNPNHANIDGTGPQDQTAGRVSLGRTCAVASYPPNGWGLHDMHGNVCEWCNDWYAESYYFDSPPEAPPGPPQGRHRVNRGGHWRSPGWASRSAMRNGSEPATRASAFGFRVVLTGQ